jgi:hypothetical protein
MALKKKTVGEGFLGFREREKRRERQGIKQKRKIVISFNQ